MAFYGVSFVVLGLNRWKMFSFFFSFCGLSLWVRQAQVAEWSAFLVISEVTCQDWLEATNSDTPMLQFFTLSPVALLLTVLPWNFTPNWRWYWCWHFSHAELLDHPQLEPILESIDTYSESTVIGILLSTDIRISDKWLPIHWWSFPRWDHVLFSLDRSLSYKVGSWWLTMDFYGCCSVLVGTICKKNDCIISLLPTIQSSWF